MQHIVAASARRRGVARGNPKPTSRTLGHFATTNETRIPREPVAVACGFRAGSQLDFDLLHHAESLADRSLLLIAGRRDTVLPREVHHAPLVEALRVACGADVTEVLLDSDHAFSDRRIALTAPNDRVLAESKVRL